MSTAYGVSADGARCGVSFLFEEGLSPRGSALFRSYVSARPLDWSLFNPLSPEPSQRNVAINRQESIELRGSNRGSMVENAYPALGVSESDSLRVLVCSGSALLGYIGGFRHEPFTERERAALGALVPDLQRRLALDQTTGNAGLHWAGLVAALEQIGSPTFILDCHGTVQHANAPGTALLRIDGTRTRERLSASIAGPASPGVQLKRLIVQGVPPHYLAVLRGGDDRARMQALAEAAAARWRLTPRQTEVLVHLSRGASNREIGATLHCAPSTTEAHLTAILRRAGVDSRASLLSRLIASSL